MSTEISETGRPQGVLPSQSGWYWCVLGEGEAGLAVVVSDPEDSSPALPVVPPQPSPSQPSATTTTYARVMSTTVPTTTTKLGRAGRKGKMNMMQKSEVIMLKDIEKNLLQPTRHLPR